MDKNVVDALKTLLEALREEVVTEVTSKLNPSASHIPEENSKQMTAKARLLNFRLTEAYEEILEAEAIRTGQSKTTWICPYISRHLLSLNPLLACCRRYSRGER